MADQPSDVMKRWFQEVWCEGKRATIHELFAADGLAHGIGPEPVVGPAGFEPVFDMLHARFDDVHIEVVESIDCGDQTYVRCEGTLKAGDETLQLEGGSLCRIADGKIQEAKNQWDWLGLLAQLGVVPADALVQGLTHGALDAPAT